jgi:hypothetical protein
MIGEWGPTEWKQQQQKNKHQQQQNIITRIIHYND